MPVETLTVPSDGSPVTTAGYYTSDSTYRIEVAGFSVLVDGEPIDGGPSSSDDVYSKEVNGRNGPFAFRIADCPGCYRDKAANVTVTIYEMRR